MKKTMYIMRHGQTLFNLRRKIQGDCDSPLTPLGIKQAEAARSFLDSLEFDYMYSSTAERASDTLELATRNRGPYTRLKGLKEMSFGVYEGESEDLNPRWENGYNEVFPKSGGESTDDVKERMKKVCTEIMEKPDHNTVFIVSHSGAIFHFMRNWADASVIFNTGGFTNCSILKFEYEDGKFEYIDIFRPTVEE